MLHFTRKDGEKVMIGDEIEIMVSQTRSGSVRLGIQAPRDVPVFRGEIYARILAQRARDAALGAGEDPGNQGADAPEAGAV